MVQIIEIFKMARTYVSYTALSHYLSQPVRRFPEFSNNPDVLRVLVSLHDGHVLIGLYHSYQLITSSDSYTMTLLVLIVQS